MEARYLHVPLIAAALLSLAANARTENFIVSAPSPQLAEEVAQYAERYRRDLALEWLGRELPPWPDKCPITVHAAPGKPAGGQTSFVFVQGQPRSWQMIVEGSRERVLDSVLPHEVTHTILATHFGCPLPRWADEGACTTVEHVSEKRKQDHLLIQFLTTNRGIAFNKMFAMRDYPPDILPLYSQGYSLARFLIAQGGKQKFIAYVGDGLRENNWTRATRKHYGYDSLSELQVTWVDWVRQGSPNNVPGKRGDLLLAAAASSEPAATAEAARSETAADQARSAAPASQGAPPSDTLATRTADPRKTWATPEPQRVAAAPNVRPTAVPAARSSLTSPAAAQASASARPTDSSLADSAGWYARQRDLASARRAEAPQSPRADPYEPAIRTRASVAQSSSRPPNMERPKQTVLEWSRGDEILRR